MIETQAGDVSAYIPTNVISITDGQIFLEPKLFYSGVRPAINVGIYVPAGRQRPDRTDAQGGGTAQARAVSVPGPGGLLAVRLRPGRGHQARLARGERLVSTLNQNERHPMPVEEQVVQIYAATNGYLDRIDVDRVPRFLADVTESIRGNEPELMKTIAGGDWSDETQRGRGRGGPVHRGLRLRPRRGGPPARGGAGGVEPHAAMATSQRDVRNRIDAVKNIQKITRAMEMVAAARLRRAEQRIEARGPTRTRSGG